MKFNENLKYLRKKEGLTQEELAERLNVSRQSVTKWESAQALPDIEKVKEIAYMFYVSVDALVGNIESPTTNKIKKKIEDVGWYILGFGFFILMLIESIYEFLSHTIQDKDLVYILIGLVVIIIFIIFVAALKSFFKGNDDVILNMKDTKEGKKERTTYIVKKTINTLVCWFVLVPILSLGKLVQSMNVFMIGGIKLVAFGVILSLILAFYEYGKLEKKLKN